jgi:hypothetical protein
MDGMDFGIFFVLGGEREGARNTRSHLLFIFTVNDCMRRLKFLNDCMRPEYYNSAISYKF